MYYNPMDKLSGPTIASKSVEIQNCETFNILITTTHFPNIYAAYPGRVDIDVPTFIRALTIWYFTPFPVQDSSLLAPTHRFSSVRLPPEPPEPPG